MAGSLRNQTNKQMFRFLPLTFSHGHFELTEKKKAVIFHVLLMSSSCKPRCSLWHTAFWETFLNNCLNEVLLFCGLTVPVLQCRTSHFPHSHAELRCDKVMDTFSGCGLCLPNLTYLSPCHFGDHRPPLCVEIKVTSARQIEKRYKSTSMTLYRQLVYFVRHPNI